MSAIWSLAPFSRSISSNRSTAAFLSTRSVFLKARITSLVPSSEAATTAFLPFSRTGPAAGRNEWNFQLPRGARKQNHIGHIVFPGMPAALESIDADSIATDLFGLQRMPDRGAFVNHLDPGGLERRHILFGTAPGRFNDLDSAFPDGRDVFRIGRRGECGKESQIDAKRLVGQVVTARNFLGQQFRRSLRQAGDNAETSGIRYRGCEFGKIDIVHAALDDRMLDVE